MTPLRRETLRPFWRPPLWLAVVAIGLPVCLVWTAIFEAVLP